MKIQLIKAPVHIGLMFMFNFRNCKVIKLYESSFEYTHCNPTLNKPGHKYFVDYNYWHSKAYQRKGFGGWILKGFYVPQWNTETQKTKRALRRMSEELLLISKSL